MFEKEQMKTQVLVPYLILLLAVTLFTFSSLTRIRQPVAQDELWWLVAAETLYTSGTPQQYTSPTDIEVNSPHLYLYLLLFSFKLFGQNEAAARLPGMVSALISIILIFLISKSLFKSNPSESSSLPVWICIFYASSAPVIQGSVIIDIDMTILVPLILLLNFFFVKYHRTEKTQWAVLSGVVLCIALWARVTTPPIIASLLVIYSLISNKGVRYKLIFMGAIVSGTLLFMATWYLYCKHTGIPLLEPFIYTVQSLQQKSLKADISFLSDFTLNLIHFILWFGILPSLILFLVAIRRCILLFKQHTLYTEDVFLINGIIIIAGYIFIGGSTFGYPKYQVSAISLVMIYIGIVVSQDETRIANLRLKDILIMVVISSAVQVLIVGDLLYDFRYSLREASAFMLPSYTEILTNMVLRTCLFITAYAVIFAVCLNFSFSKSIVVLLLIISLGSNIGTSLIQSTAHYYIGYNYGGQGTIQVANYIRDTVPADSTVIAPSEIIYYLNLPRSRHVPNNIWTDTYELRKQLDNPNTSGLAYSIATNTIQQIRTISFSQSIQETLNRNYRQTEIGSYKVWIRKTTS